MVQKLIMYGKFVVSSNMDLLLARQTYLVLTEPES
jgi:hypothetical protein